MEHIIFWNFLLATALGALIGTERAMPWSKQKWVWVQWNTSGFGGIRTYALLAFFGAISTWMDMIFHTDMWKISGMILSGIFVLISYIYSSFRQGKIWVTSEYAAILTYIIGVVVMSGYKIVAVILAVLILILLSSKEYLSEWKGKLSREELSNSLKFAVISLVALPLLPDGKFSIATMLSWVVGNSLHLESPILTMDFFNPYWIWLFVVVMAGIEYVGYILSKVLWNRSSILASGIIGWLISSTATTAAMTHKSILHPSNYSSYTTATIIASCIMFVRVILISSFYNPEIVNTILLPSSIMLITLAGSAYYFFWKSKKQQIGSLSTFSKWRHHEQTEIQEDSHLTDSYESPFQLIPALKFAGIVAVVKFLAWIGIVYSGHIPESIFNYVLGLISWLADVDAITQTMASESTTGRPVLMVAAFTILIAIMSNNVVKATIAYRFWEKNFGRAVVTGFGISILSGILVILAMTFLA